MPTVFDHFVVQTPALTMDKLAVSETIYAALDQQYGQFKGHILISAHQFTEDWPTWEQHPAGDEMVILLSGQATMKLRTADGTTSTQLTTTGEFIIVPEGVWHTACISVPTTMLFITAGEGTLNQTEPD
ncbi:MAG: hypothetical protein KDI36_04215 [Pseudomonadales bacterium]|nr:hypothetical protein [Pseudomonadales bacterium]